MANNYYQSFLNQLEQISKQTAAADKKPQLLLHACCGPCSTAVLELLEQYFDITMYFYNPNIYPQAEHDRRQNELSHFLDLYSKNRGTNKKAPSIQLVSENYLPDDFYRIAAGMEQLKEGGERCFACYRLRLRQAFIYAKAHQADFVTTTLSISPHKNAQKINEIGQELQQEFDLPFLFSDFKKKDGFKRSLQLSAEYQLYRQDYCGCEFSLAASPVAK